MRLGDLDDLKVHISELTLVYSGAELDNAILNAIDSAPTIEPFEPDYVGAERLKARQRGYEEGYRNGMEIGKTLNPNIKQGEWILISGSLKCPFCGFRDYRKTIYNYCSVCGADMRNGNSAK